MEKLATRRLLHRIHRTGDAATFFGRTADWRFNSPLGTYGVLYAAPTEETAFAETLLRGQHPMVAKSELRIRSICAFELRRPIRLVKLHGASLIAIGATAAATAGDYAGSQSWAQALHDHPDQPDGILYRSSRDNDRFAVALFDRAAAALDNGKSCPLLDDAVRLGRILDHYGASLV